MSAVTREGVPAAVFLVDDAALPLGQALHLLVRQVATDEDVVVLATAPGCGTTVAAAIEAARIAPIVATMAGEETVLTRTRSAIAARVVARYFSAVAEVWGVCPVRGTGVTVEPGVRDAPPEKGAPGAPEEGER